MSCQSHRPTQFRNLLYFGNLHQSITIILKASLKWVPIVGPAMQMFRFIFMHRNWEADKVGLAKALRKMGDRARRSMNPMVLLICECGHGLSFELHTSQPCRTFPDTHLILATDFAFPKSPFSPRGHPGLEGHAPHQQEVRRQGWHTGRRSHPPATIHRTSVLSQIAEPEDTRVEAARRDHSLSRDTWEMVRRGGLSGSPSCCELSTPDTHLYFPRHPIAPLPSYGQDYYTLQSIFGAGVPPPVIHMHLRSIHVKHEVPLGHDTLSQSSSTGSERTAEEKKAFDGWLLAKWRLKDERLESFVTRGTLEAQSGRPTQFVDIPLKLRTTRELATLFAAAIFGLWIAQVVCKLLWSWAR